MGKLFTWDPSTGDFNTLFEFSQENGSYPYGAIPWTSLTLYSNEELCGNGKVLICHHTGSSSNPCVELCVNENAVQAHLDHGDNLGHCSCNDKSSDIVADQPDEYSFTVYPDPVDQTLNLDFYAASGENLKIEITSLLGQLIYTSEIKDASGDFTYPIKMNSVPDGMYILRVNNVQSVTAKHILVLH